MSSLPPSPSPSSRSHSSAEVEEQLLSPQAPHDSSDTEGREESTSPGNPPQPSATLPGEDNTDSDSDTTAQDLIEEAEVEAQLLIKELDVTDDELIKLEEHLTHHKFLDASTDIADIKTVIKRLRDTVMTKSQFLQQKMKEGHRTYAIEASHRTISLSRIKQKHVARMGLPGSRCECVSEQTFKVMLAELLKPVNQMNLTLIREWKGVQGLSETLDLIRKHLGGLNEARSRFIVDQFILEVLRLFREIAGLRNITVQTEPVLATQKSPAIFDNPAEKRALIVTGKADHLIASFAAASRGRPFPFHVFKAVVTYTDIITQSEKLRRIALMIIETKNLSLKDLTPYLYQAMGEALVIMSQPDNEDPTDTRRSEGNSRSGGAKVMPKPVSFCLTNSETWIFGVVICKGEGSYMCRYTDSINGKESNTSTTTDLFHAFALWATLPGSALYDAMINKIELKTAGGKDKLSLNDRNPTVG
ncbi:hypothetical protein ONZ45_g1102 [Pleurotus djamor]|nr:hypothetical protein ONZ45_g1102 [Pleurotus djamor]